IEWRNMSRDLNPVTRQRESGETPLPKEFRAKSLKSKNLQLPEVHEHTGGQFSMSTPITIQEEEIDIPPQPPYEPRPPCELRPNDDPPLTHPSTRAQDLKNSDT
ncbi:hypothetical protein AAMO2058_001544400, partial [Amorphochlora amoebiformis]